METTKTTEGVMAGGLVWTESTTAGGAAYYRTQSFSYGHDEKGREVGGYAVIDSRPAGYRTNRGAFFQLSLYATRNGSRFGAIPSSTSFDTLDEAKAAAPAKLKAQAARYAKKFAPRANDARAEREEQAFTGPRGETP